MKYIVELIGKRHGDMCVLVNNNLQTLDDFIQRLKDDSNSLTSFVKGGYNGE